MKITTFNNLEEITGNEGKILLYDEAKSKIGASTETVNEIIQDQVGGDISRLEGRVNTVESDVDALNSAIALKADADKVYTKTQVDEKFADFGGFEVAEGTGEDSHPNVENPDAKKIYLVKKGTNNDKYCEWIWTKEEGSSENTWVLIGETTVDLTDYVTTSALDDTLTGYQPVSSMESYYTKSETSAASAISDALALKEDKVFIAEYNVTPYADIKAAYDAGKQIVCKYTRAEEDQSEDVLYFTGIIFDSVPGVFVFQKLTGSQTSFQIFVGNNIPWGSVNAELQNKLTFAGENNTITSINTSAVGKTLTAGTDLVINNGVIGVNTNGTAQGTYAFAQGEQTSAVGNASYAEGLNTFAADIADHVEGIGGRAEQGGCNHVEGFQYHCYTSNGASIFAGTNIVKFYNGGFGNGSRFSIPGPLYDFVKAFKENFIVTCDYDTVSEYHYSSINSNPLYNPLIFNIIDVTLDVDNSINITLDKNIPNVSGGSVNLCGPVCLYRVTGGGSSLSSDQTLNTYIINGSLGFPGHNLENIRIDNAFIQLSCSYRLPGDEEYTFYNRVLKISSIEYDASNSRYVFTTEEDVVIPTILSGGYSFNIYVISPTYYGLNHIEGADNAVVEGSMNHIEGYNNFASGGNYNHAEGLNNFVKNASHAEGYQTSAVGINSHTEGYYTSANGAYSHAEGRSTIAYSEASHAEGHETSAIGDYAHSEGHQTSAVGNQTHAEGYQSSAQGDQSHAEGAWTLAKGQGAHAEGFNTTAEGIQSHSEGFHTSAKGTYSHAEGQNTSAIGYASHSEGGETRANGQYSHAQGYQSTANGDYSFVAGPQALANDDYSISLGNHATARNSNAIAIGTTAQAYGQYSVSIGYNTIANDSYSIAIGNNTTAYGYNAAAIGYCTSAGGQYSLAVNGNTSAAGNNSFAGGQNSYAGGYFSFAFGQYASANSNNSVSIGMNTLASNYNTTVIGKNNTNSTAAFVVGNGNDSDNRSDAFVVDWEGVASATTLKNADGIVPSLIPTASQPAGTTACSMYVDANGKFYIVTAN